MKIIVFTIMLFSSVSFAEVYSYQRDIYPIFARNCASCHNVNTPDMNWLDKNTAINNKNIMYFRVFQQGDMPMWFKYFGGKDKEILKQWLEMPEVTNIK